MSNRLFAEERLDKGQMSLFTDLERIVLELNWRLRPSWWYCDTCSVGRPAHRALWQKQVRCECGQVMRNLDRLLPKL